MDVSRCAPSVLYAYDLGALWVSGWMPGPRTPPGAQSCADTPTRVRAHRRANPVTETLSAQSSPTPSRSGDLWTFLGVLSGSATCMTPGHFGPLVGCRGHGHLRVRVVRTPPPGCEHTGEQVLLIKTPSVQSSVAAAGMLTTALASGAWLGHAAFVFGCVCGRPGGGQRRLRVVVRPLRPSSAV